MQHLTRVLRTLESKFMLYLWILKRARWTWGASNDPCKPNCHHCMKIMLLISLSNYQQLEHDHGWWFCNFIVLFKLIDFILDCWLRYKLPRWKPGWYCRSQWIGSVLQDWSTRWLLSWQLHHALPRTVWSRRWRGWRVRLKAFWFQIERCHKHQLWYTQGKRFTGEFYPIFANRLAYISTVSPLKYVHDRFSPGSIVRLTLI